MAKRSSVFILSLILICTTVLIVWDIHRPGYFVTESPAILKRISYGFTIQNTSGHLVERAELRVNAPRSESPTQRLQEIYSSHPHDVEYDSEGNAIFCYTFDSIPPHATRIITLKADLLMRAVPLRGPNREDESCLAEDRFIEVNDPHIRDLARSLNTGGSLITAEKIFHWIVKNIRYTSYVKNNRGALVTLLARQGDCTEMMHLFVALCRAAGVPVRCIAGYHSPEGGVLEPAQYHNWAEFYAEGRWWLCDPQRRVFMQEADDYVALKIIRHSPAARAFEFDRFHVAGAGMVGRMQY
ncbi:MAG: transglutaminase domain-containing protein [Desulfobacterales bacterium]